MSSLDHSISNNENVIYQHAFSSNNSTGKIPPEFSPFYNMKDIQAFYAKELPIPLPDPITPPIILTPSPVLPPSLLMPPKKVSTSTAPAMTHATIQQLISNGIVAALEALAATMANTDNPNRNLGSIETPIEKKETTKSSYAVNHSTLTVHKELFDSSAGLNVLN
nr:hypothetical protein [Tanacetum cinerariifolium]